MSDVNAGQLHRLARLLRSIASEATTDPGEGPVPPGDIAIIEDIAEHASTTIGEISRRTGLAQSLVSKTVATLRAHDVLTATADPSDGRRTLITLDPSARAGVLDTRAQRGIKGALVRQLPGGSPADHARVERLLEDLWRELVGGPDGP